MSRVRQREGRTQTEAILMRFEPAHLDLITRAADYLALPRASWMRSALLQAARAVLKDCSQ